MWWWTSILEFILAGWRWEVRAVFCLICYEVFLLGFLLDLHLSLYLIAVAISPIATVVGLTSSSHFSMTPRRHALSNPVSADL